MTLDPAGLVAAMPFAATLGVELDEAGPQLVRGRLAWSAERCTAGGTMHGGAMMTLADSLNAVCAFLNLPAGASTATIESTTHFLRGVRAGTVHASSRPVHVGRSTIVVAANLADDDGRPVAHVIQTQAVTGPG